MNNKEISVSWSDIHSREKRRRRRIASAVFLLLISAVSIGGLWVVVYSPLFGIKDIEITGNSRVSSSSVTAVAKAAIFGNSFWKLVLGFNNILVWPEEFSGNDLRFIPELKAVYVQKKFGDKKIKITVEEREPFGIWCFHQTRANTELAQTDAEKFLRNSAPSPRESACWWFDPQGIIFKKAIAAEGNVIVSLQDYSQKNVGLNSKILPDEFISNAFSVFRAISSGNLRVKEVKLKDLILQEIEADTYDGPKIYFSLRFPADNVPEIIKSLREKYVFGNLEYVDFRVENRVYYK